MGINYSVEADPESTARAMLRERPMSLKHSKAIAREIRGETVGDAIEYLEAVIAGERSVPFRQHNSGVGHRKDIEGWDAGRYPNKASEEFVTLLRNAVNNADELGFDGESMKIAHLAPHKVDEQQGVMSRAMGRTSPKNTPLIDVELVVEEREARSASDGTSGASREGAE